MFVGQSGGVKITASDLKGKIQRELKKNETKTGWGGEGVEIRRNQFTLTPALRGRTQNQGLKHGCHTCLTKLAIDPDQPWIGDHIPPTELNDRARTALSLDKKGSLANLFPQCDECASQQSSLVKRLNGMNSTELKNWTPNDNEDALIGGGQAATTTYSIGSTGPKVTTAEGSLVQKLGAQNGCHSCGSIYPRSIYHADHTFPQEWCTTYMEEVFEKLGLTYPAKFYLKPQCPKCSGNQGGNVSSIMWDAVNYALQNGITVTKDMSFTVGTK